MLRDAGQVRGILAEVRAAEAAVGRRGEGLRVLADLVVFLDSRPGAARERKARLDELMARSTRPTPLCWPVLRSRPLDLLLEWHEACGYGFRLRPGVLPGDLASIVREPVHAARPGRVPRCVPGADAARAPRAAPPGQPVCRPGEPGLSGARPEFRPNNRTCVQYFMPEYPICRPRAGFPAGGGLKHSACPTVAPQPGAIPRATSARRCLRPRRTG